MSIAIRLGPLPNDWVEALFGVPSMFGDLEVKVLYTTCYRRGVTIEQMIVRLNRYLIGWRGYFDYCQSRSILQVLNQPNHRGTDPYARWCDRESP
jgi:hypothetical protein